jgi:High potential iron-sulfur protein
LVDRKFTRRDLLRAGASMPALSAVLVGAAPAAELPLVSTADPVAKAMLYVENAAKAKGAKPGSHCGDCALYMGKAGAKTGPCSLFVGKSVYAAGWCMAWAAKPK